MKDYQISLSLLNKIAENLNELKNDDALFAETSRRLHNFLEGIDTNSKALTEIQCTELRKILTVTYRKLISLEENGKLTTAQTGLLNNLDELDEVIIGMK